MKIKIGDAEYIVEKLPNGKWTLPEAFENGDNECRCGALNIDGNRVPSNEELGRNNNTNPYGSSLSWSVSSTPPQNNVGQVEGRYPSQTFCDSNTAEVLDKQSGILKSGDRKPDEVNNDECLFGFGGKANGFSKGSIGGCSKILHKCNYEKEDYDIYNYNPKVSKGERNAGCVGKPQQYSHDGRNKETETPHQRNKSVAVNNHPTLKPIALNERILKLFKTPNEDKIVYPFAGSGSEVIGGIKAGFNNWTGCEINPDYVEIAKARIDHWTTQDEQQDIFYYMEV